MSKKTETIPPSVILIFFLINILVGTIMIGKVQSATLEEADPEVVQKQKEADIAEAEARIFEAQQKVAEAKKAIEKAENVKLTMAEIEKVTAEAEKGAAEAAKAEFEAKLPTTVAQPLAGNVTVDDNAGYFAEILAYETVTQNAELIVQDLNAQLGAGIVKFKNIFLVTNPDYLKLGLALKEVDTRVSVFDDTVQALLSTYTIIAGNITKNESAGLVALSAIPAVLGSLADAAALFRKDRVVKGKKTNINSDVLLYEVARQLRKNASFSQVKITKPSLNAKPNPPILISLQSTGGEVGKATLRLAQFKAISAQLESLIQNTSAEIALLKDSLKALNSQHTANVATINAEITRLKTIRDKPESVSNGERDRIQTEIVSEEKKLNDLTENHKTEQNRINDEILEMIAALDAPKNQKALADLIIPQFEAVITAFTSFRATLLTAPKDSTSTPLQDLAEVSLLQDSNIDDDTYLLTASVVGQGGEVETRKSIWTSGKIFHRAGSACSYALFSNKGEIVASGLTVSNKQKKEGVEIPKKERESK